MHFHLVASAVALTLAMPATAVQLIVNGGFETGDFTGWTQFANTAFTGVAGGAQAAGSFGAFFGPVGSTGGIRQTVATVAGVEYRLSFLLQNGSGDPVNRHAAFLDGVTQVNVTNAPAFGYTYFAYNFFALDAATTVALRFQHDPSFYYLDNVSFVAVPEPVTWTLMIAGFGLVGLGLRRRRIVAAA